jgi:exodeoxyribonuclease VII large subunit
MAEPAFSNLPEWSVTELAHAVKRTMEQTFDRVRVRGELGRVTVAKSGHLYADLKDDGAVISLVMWKGNLSQLRFRPEEGLEVIAEGKLSTFPGKSTYQLIADRLEPAGAGALLAQLEKLKAKLAGEGLFDAARKKPIPYLPTTIGVVTSPTGAVIRDILHRLEERFPRHVLLWPVLVQGKEAAGQVAAAIKGFNAIPPGGAIPRPDVLIVARGGGSIEDLWAFNEEIVARAVAASEIAIISAVGHETDTTLIDFVSDLRAPTPTGAAEKAVPVRAELTERAATAGGRLTGALARLFERRRTELRAAGARLPRLDMTLGLAQQRLDRAGDRLSGALVTAARAQGAKLDRVAVRLRPEGLKRDFTRRAQRLAELEERLALALKRKVGEKAKLLNAPARLLETLSHKATLARGFALVVDAHGALVRGQAALQAGDEVVLTFADGAMPAQVLGPNGEGRRKKGAGAKQGELF